jgi:hypothetical protein
MKPASDAPSDWRFDRLAVERTQAVAAFGLTERQARFLVEVMIHSGVFIERQYRHFAGIVHGQKTHDFLRKLVERGYARPIQVGSLHRGRLFHVGHKPLYAAIGQGDNRHRKSMPIGRMVERLMVFDAVLADRSFTWLGTEQDKRTHFLTHLQERVREDEFPRITFGSGKASSCRSASDRTAMITSSSTSQRSQCRTTSVSSCSVMRRSLDLSGDGRFKCWCRSHSRARVRASARRRATSS